MLILICKSNRTLCFVFADANVLGKHNLKYLIVLKVVDVIMFVLHATLSKAIS